MTRKLPSDRANVFLAVRLPKHALTRIEAECNVTAFAGKGMPSKEELIAEIAEADGLLGSAQLPVDADVFNAAPRLRVVSNFGVGYDNVDLAAAKQRGVIVCNTPGVLSSAVADLTMGLMVSLARRLPESERFVREGRWKPGAGMGLGVDVSGKTLGVIGLGRIGVAVAKRAQAFSMTVIFHDQFREPPAEVGFSEYRDMEALLRDSDFVSLHVNLRPETHHLIGREQLALMKPTASLINTARGQIVDQPALVQALQDGEIAGAALDVFEEEPLPVSNPLMEMMNVILLPHIGSASVETREAMRDLSIDNLLRALRGERPKAVVNPEVLAQD